MYIMSEELFDEDEFITLTDEDGKEETFIVLCVIEYNGSQYYALLPEKQGKKPCPLRRHSLPWTTRCCNPSRKKTEKQY